MIEKVAHLLSRHRFTSRSVGIVQSDRDYAREAVRIVSGAIRDGKSDRVLGIVGRSDPLKAYQVLPAGVRFSSLDVQPKDEVVLIAFRKGEEEWMKV